MKTRAESVDGLQGQLGLAQLEFDALASNSKLQIATLQQVDVGCIRDDVGFFFGNMHVTF